MLAGLAIANGAFREGVLLPLLGERWAHVASTLLLCALIFGLAWLAVKWIRPASLSRAWGAGALWLAATLAFEFLAGHYVFRQSWERLLADYDVLRGRLWPLVLLATLVAPPWAAWVRR